MLYSFDPFMAANGILGGLVAITASSPMVRTEGSFVIGVLSGVLVFYGSKVLLRVKVGYCCMIRFFHTKFNIKIEMS